MYCKFLKTVNDCQLKSVLIVAKCIVNLFFLFLSIFLDIVLIVAKCIVNSENHFFFAESQSRINSSKVYCKLI